MKTMQSLKEIFLKTLEIDVSSLNAIDSLSFLISISSLIVATLSLIVALIVLIYAGYQYVIKKGIKFYGTYSIASSIWSKQPYVSQIIIENKKDKAAAIDYIYLRIARNIYLELVDYSDSPRIIAPFETIKIELREGVSGYIASTYKINLDDLLTDYKIHKTLMVATPQGLSKVKHYKKHWNIYFESLSNNSIIPVRRVLKYYNEKEYSDGLQFVVTYINDDGSPQEHYLYSGISYSINGISVKTDDFHLSSELEQILKTQENPVSRTLTVKRVGYTFSDYDNFKPFPISHRGFFGTHVLGKFRTKLYKWLLRMNNRIERFRKS